LLRSVKLGGISDMKLLAFEFSSGRRSVAVWRDGEGFEAEHSAGGATPFVALSQRVLARAGLRAADIEAVAVGLGPGSYTGVRLGIAAAQGWAVASGVRVAGVSSFDAIALAAVRSGIRRGWVATDAQRGEAAVAEFVSGGTDFHWERGLGLVSADQLRELVRAGAVVLGHGLPGVDGISVASPSAIDIAALAAGRQAWAAPESLEAVYLREAAFAKAPRPREVTAL
jgi:tRNA threonylcarbamoyladenosine biosynthesis protein TsaB